MTALGIKASGDKGGMTMKKLLYLAPVLVLFIFCSSVFAQELKIDWTEGPSTIDLKGELAQIELGGDYIFAGAEDTKKILEYMGNPPSNTEIGIIFPKDENKEWYVVFEYDPVGYIRDDEKDDIDADAILEGIKEGNEEANKIREEQGFDPLHIVGWYEAPYYDDATHNLTWSILGESESGQVVNYNTRLLGRYGYTSVMLVSTPSDLDLNKGDVHNIISSFSYKEGKSYAEYVKGDKVAKYGLTALIAGGAGAVAAKTGLLNVLVKAWKAVLAGVAAFFVAISRYIKRLFGKK